MGLNACKADNLKRKFENHLKPNHMDEEVNKQFSNIVGYVDKNNMFNVT